MPATESALPERADTRALLGVWAPAATPFDADLMPDAGLLCEHVKRLFEEGCHGVALFGTTGEGTSLSVEERIQLLETVLGAGVPPTRLMVGTGCAAITDTVRLTAAVAALGCHKVLMLPPFFYKEPSEEGIFASYARVIERVADTRLRILLYHFPKHSAVPIAHSVIRRLSRSFGPMIQGLKDGSGDPESVLAFIEAFPELAIYPANETLLPEAVAQGAAGAISAAANIDASAIRRLYDACGGSGRAETASLTQRLAKQRSILAGHPMIPTLKHILRREYDTETWMRVRPPLAGLSQEVGDSVREALRDNGLRFGTA